MSETPTADKTLLSKMEVIHRYFPKQSYRTVNPIFYEKDFPKFFIPGKKRPLYPKDKVEEWIDSHIVYGF